MSPARAPSEVTDRSGFPSKKWPSKATCEKASMWLWPLVVIIRADVVFREANGPRSDVDVGQHRHVMIGGHRHVDPGLGPQGLAEGDRLARARKPQRGGDSSPGEMVQGSAPPVVAPATPVGDRADQLAELAGCHVHLSQRRNPRPYGNHPIGVTRGGAAVPRRSGMSAATSVPFLGGPSTRRRPSSTARRSRSPRSPLPSRSAPPTPSSLTAT
jgi:hypothetical protein